MDVQRFRVSREKSALVVVDVQEKLVRAMDPDDWVVTERAIGNLIYLAKLFQIPIFLTEQYPKGLGPTIQPIQKELEDASKLTKVEKIEFSSWANSQFRTAFEQGSFSQAIVVGLECHICVAQTVLDLLAAQYKVFVPHDGVLSRKEEDMGAGLDFMELAGATIVSSEMIIFQILEKAGTEEFRKMSRRVK